MGIGPLSSSSYPCGCTSTPVVTPANNPNPARYTLKYAEQIGNYLIVKIQYPDCMNYEGLKIMVYRNVTVEDLLKQKLIDPHFSDNYDWISPLARFEPTDWGMMCAKVFCQQMNIMTSL